jgi:hypothetical protein
VSALLLAALFCAPVSAQVVETGGAAVSAAPVSGAVGAVLGAGASIAPISAVPMATSLVPSLNTASGLQAAPAARLPAGAVGFAPTALPALPAAAAVVDAVPGAAPAPTSHPTAKTAVATSPDQIGTVAAPKNSVPPAGTAAQTGMTTVAASRGMGGGSEIDAAGRVHGADRALAGALDAPEAASRGTAEGALSEGRKLFDRSGDSGALSEGVAAAPSAAAPAAPLTVSAAPDGAPALAPTGAASASVPVVSGPRDEALRDAVASPVSASGGAAGALSFFRVFGAAGGPAALNGAVPGAPAPAAPFSLERLTLELRGLAVQVRAAFGLAPLAAAPRAASAAPAAPSSVSAARRAPITSTEWLERRGLLETISISEAAAAQTAAAASPLPAPARASVSVSAYAPAALTAPALVLDSTAPARVPPLIWWGLAFLPAVLVLIKETL